MAFEKDALEKDIAATTREAAEAVRRVAAEPARSMAGTAQGMAGAARGMAGTARDMAGTARDMAEPVRRGADTMARYNTAAVSGAQNLWQEWLAVTQETIDRRMDAWSTLLQTTNPQTAFAVQSQWLKDEIAMAFNHGLRLAQAATGAVRDTADRSLPR